MHTAHKTVIQFGLLSIPVRLGVTAGKPAGLFHQVHGKMITEKQGRKEVTRQCGGQLKQDRFCSACGEEHVTYGDVAKGFEVPGTGQHVILTDDEIEKSRGWQAKTFQVEHFAPAGQADPLLFDSHYFVEAVDGGQRAAALLLSVMESKDLTAIGTIGFRDREAPAILWVRDHAFMLTTLFWPEDLRTADLFQHPVEAPWPSEVKMAAQLIDSMTRDFDPAEHTNTYAANVRELAMAKAAGSDLPAGPPAPKTSSGAPDLTAVLTASIAERKKAGVKQPLGK
jgi:DNA end-binding protein Ku